MSFKKKKRVLKDGSSYPDGEQWKETNTLWGNWEINQKEDRRWMKSVCVAKGGEGGYVGMQGGGGDIGKSLLLLADLQSIGYKSGECRCTVYGRASHS